MIAAARRHSSTVPATKGPRWVVVAVTSTVLFTAVHLLTNRVSSYQVASWAIGGLVLVMAYLVSGSIWVPVVLHATEGR